MVTPAHRDSFFFLFLNFESSAAENDVITMQPSCSQLNLSVIIALIILAACRLMVTVLSLDGVSGRKWGSHFTHSHFPRSFHLHSPVSAAKVWKWHQFLRSGACTRARWKSACTSSRICVRPETVPPRRRTKLDWRRQEDNDRDVAETFFFMQGSGRERKRPLERRGNAGGGRVSGETSKRAVSPPQMRLLCQVQGYYDAAEESPLKQEAKSRQDWRSQTTSFSLARQFTSDMDFLLFFFS